MGYETPGYIPICKLNHIDDRLFKKCLQKACNYDTHVIDVNLFELLVWLKLDGIYDEYGLEICKIHGELSRPQEVISDFSDMLHTVLQFLDICEE